MHVVPESVGTASRSWDDQVLDLTAAAKQINEVPTSGFAPDVAQAADTFSTAWNGLAQTLAGACETRADGLRTAVRDYLESDQASAADLERLRDYLVEVP